MSIPVIRDHTGVERKLGWVPPSRELLKLRASKTSIEAHRAKDNPNEPPLIPRDKWRERDFVTGYPLELIEDQEQYGACTAATSTGADNRQRELRGDKWEKLAWTWLYDQVNGGRDAGSNIWEANEVVRRLGVPPRSAYPDCQFRANRNPSGVIYYKEAVEITLATVDQIGTALQMNIFCQIPIDAGGGFENFDGDGISQGQGSNPNHSIYIAGMKKIRGVWVFRLVNSWRPTWGPLRDGTCWVTERQIMNCASADDGIGHAVTISTSN